MKTCLLVLNFLKFESAGYGSGRAIALAIFYKNAIAKMMRSLIYK